MPSMPRTVVVFLRQVLEVDAGVLYHARELAGRENRIDVGYARVALELRADALGLLSGAGHDGDAVDVFGGDSLRLWPIGLREGSEHSLRRLRG